MIINVINPTAGNFTVQVGAAPVPKQILISQTRGPAGQGIIPGGTAGQVLTKNSNTDYDMIWSSAGGGGGAVWGGITGTLTNQADLVSYVNGRGFITSVPAQSFSSLSGKPTSISGYGITDTLSQTLTGYVSGAATVSAADSILTAFNKINGNVTLKAPIASPTFTGTVTLPAGTVINSVLTGYTSGAGTISATDSILTAINKLNGNAITLSGANSWTGAQTISISSIGATFANGLSLLNTTAAATGAQQNSPFQTFQGNGWTTLTTAHSQAVTFRMGVIPLQMTAVLGSAGDPGSFVIQRSLDGSGFDSVFTIGVNNSYIFGPTSANLSANIPFVSFRRQDAAECGQIVSSGNAFCMVAPRGIFQISTTTIGSVALMIPSTNNVLIGTSTDISTVLLNLSSTTKGFLPPRMTTTQKNAITTPTSGTVVYDSTLNKLCVFGASAWETVTSS